MSDAEMPFEAADLAQADRARREAERAPATVTVAGGDVTEFDFRLHSAAATGTEGALSRVFVERHGGDALYVREDRAWARWAGDRWRRDDDVGARALVAGIVRDLYAAASRCTPEDSRAARLGKFAVKADAATFQRHALTLAEPPLATDAAAFDAEPEMLNVSNGVLDLRTRELRPHEPAAMCSRLAATAYDPAADCPLWRSAIERWLPGDDDAQRFARRLVGYLLVGVNVEKRIVLLSGPADTGKSTFIETARAILGDYATTIALASLLDSGRTRSGSEHTEDLAKLAGRRAAFGAESMRGRKLDEGKVKLLTGGDTIPARPAYGKQIEFANQCRLVVATNHLPKLDGGDDAMVRRLAVLPFVAQIPRAEQDTTLKARLLDEARSGGILNWALDGLEDWRANGLGSAPAVQAATAEYVRREDAVGRFIDGECELGPNLWTTREAVRARWSRFALAEGVESTYHANELFGALRERGFAERKRRGTQGFLGLAVRLGDSSSEGDE